MEEKSDKEPENRADKDSNRNNLIPDLCWENLSSDDPHKTRETNIEENK